MMVLYSTVRHLYLMSLFPYLQALTVYTKPELCDKWERLEEESETLENKQQIECMVWYQVGISYASITHHASNARVVMGEFTKYEDVIEKRKLFFDESGQPRIDFL